MTNGRPITTKYNTGCCFRGLESINTHATLSVLVMQSVALAKIKAGRIDEVRMCVRQVG